jgi:hypothetical protein
LVCYGVWGAGGEQYRAKNDINNAVYAGFIAGAILAFQSGGGPRGVLAGGAGFAGFSGLIDLYMRRDTPFVPSPSHVSSLSFFERESKLTVDSNLVFCDGSGTRIDL